MNKTLIFVLSVVATFVALTLGSTIIVVFGFKGTIPMALNAGFALGVGKLIYDYLLKKKSNK